MASDTVKSVTKNVVVLTVTRSITMSSTLILMLFLPRYLGPVGYGRYFLGQSIAAIFLLLIEFGGNYSITKAITRNPDATASIVANALGIRLILWVIAFSLMMCYAFAAGYSADVVWVIAIFGVAMIFTSVNTVMGSSYRGRELLKYPAYASIAETVFVAITGISCLLLGIGPITFAVISLSGSFLGMVVMLYHRSSLFSSLSPVEWKTSAALLKDGYPYFLNAIFGVIYFRIDTVMLSLMTSEKIVGWYGASYRFFDSLMIIPNIFTIAIFPMLSRRFGRDPESIPRIMQKSLDFIILAGIPMCVGAFTFSPEIIHLFYGVENYGPSVLVLRIFSIGIPLLYIDFILGTILMASDRQKQLTRISFFAIGVNVSLNYVLITYTQAQYGNGGIGSAFATLATELFVMVNMIMAMPKGNFAGKSVARQMKIIASGAVMAVGAMMINELSIAWFIKAIIAGTTYLLALGAVKAITSEDIATAATVFRDQLSEKKKQHPEDR